MIRLFSRFFILVAVSLFAVFAAAYAQEKTSADMAQRLCAGSPWTGPWESIDKPAFSGTWELTFSCTGGKLGATLNSTGSSVAGFVQDVSSLRIEEGKVKFGTKGGGSSRNTYTVDYELALNEEGKLAGKGSARDTRIKGSLSPSKKVDSPRDEPLLVA